MNAQSPVITGVFDRLLTDEIRANTRRTRAFAASFHSRSGFRERYDAHVEAWKRAGSAEAYILYHTDPAFAAEHDRRIQALRDEPMPAWGGRNAL